MLVQNILSRLRSGGSVLIPVSPGGRVLELLLVLQRYWQNMRLVYPILFVSYVANSLRRVIEGNLEFMEEGLNQEFLRNRKSAFSPEELSQVRFISDVEYVKSILRQKEPRLILCSSETLESGLSKELFIQFAQDRKNLVLFVDRTQDENSMSRKLVRLAQQQMTIYPEIRFKVSNWTYRNKQDVDEWRKNEKQRYQAKERKEKQLMQQKQLENELMKQVSISDDAKASNPGFQRKGLFKLFSERSKINRETMFSYTDPFKTLRSTKYGFSISNLNFETKTSSTKKTQLKKEVKKPKEKQLTEETFLTQEFGNLVIDASLQAKFRERIPRTLSFEDITVNIRCRLQYVDLEGRSDARSYRFFIEKLAPKKLVIVHGSQTHSSELKQDVVHLFQTNYSVVCPDKILQPFQISSSVGVWNLPMDLSLLNQSDNFLLFNPEHQIFAEKELSISYVEGEVVNQEEEGNEGVENRTQSNQDAMLVPYDIPDEYPSDVSSFFSDSDIESVGSIDEPKEEDLEPQDEVNIVGKRQRKPELNFWDKLKQRKKKLYIKDRTVPPAYLAKKNFSLISLEKELKAKGIDVSFKKGILFGSNFMVRKEGSNIRVEGAGTPDFFIVQKELSKLFSIV
eukprot:snap_masked-scaffold_2-processed-gene-24.5-mRNA-1 protein AED:1.00 eAED:1.00 QI:0/-1/0/0/-1/1/1/0/623